MAADHPATIHLARLALACAALTLCRIAPPVYADASDRLLAAPEFSAEIVTRDADRSITSSGGRLYVADGKVRIETRQASSGFFLVDAASDTAWFVQAAQRVFTDAKQSTRFTQIFIPVDPHDPCSRWQRATAHAGVRDDDSHWRCQRVGPDSAGQETLEYRLIGAGTMVVERWVEPALALVVKERTSDGGTIELENIRIGAQSPELFVLPAGYRKLDPQALIERMRHSDVWAAPKD